MIRLIILVLCACASGAAAQGLPVRTGEHEGYTRLVVQVPQGTDWTLLQRQNGAQLSVAIDDVTFDTRSAFDRLSGNRLQALTQLQAGGALDMAFGCDCVATAFLHRQTMVVIDIAPGKYTPKLATPPALPLPSSEQNALPAEIPANGLALPLLELNQRGYEDQLISRILQGADREVVDLTLAGVGQRPSTPVGPVRATELSMPNLQLRSVLDGVRGLEALELPKFDMRKECITDSDLGFETWSDADTPFAAQVSDQRIALYREFDKIDTAHALKLARLYLYHGFGSEALQVLKLLPRSPAEKEQLATIAHVLDGFTAPATHAFAGQQRCAGTTALWALMAEGRLEEDANLDAIEQSFGQLPRHLRRQLGARVSEILVAAGKLEASRRILRAVERVVDAPTADLTLAKAEIAAAAGNDEATEKLLSDTVLATNTTEAPLALARLIEKRWADRGAVSLADLDLAAGYARQLRRSDLGPMMARAHVLALALTNEFDQALSRLESAAGTSEWQRTRDQVLQLLAERADDITFLRYTFAIPDETSDGMTVETAALLAKRLANLGFSAPAQALAGRPEDRTQRLDRARIRAHAALLDDRPHQALLEIAEDASDEAQQLRARAMSQTDDYSEAARLLRAIGDDAAADRFVWLAGNSEDQPDPSTVFGKIGALSVQLGRPADRQPEKPLADATTLLQDSQTTRAQIAELLEHVRGNSKD